MDAKQLQQLVAQAEQQIEWADATSDFGPLLIAVSLQNDVLEALTAELARIEEANREEVAA